MCFHNVPGMLWETARRNSFHFLSLIEDSSCVFYCSPQFPLLCWDFGSWNLEQPNLFDPWRKCVYIYQTLYSHSSIYNIYIFHTYICLYTKMYLQKVWSWNKHILVHYSSCFARTVRPLRMNTEWNAHGIHGSLHRENAAQIALGEYMGRSFFFKRIFPQGALDNIHEVMFLCFFLKFCFMFIHVFLFWPLSSIVTCWRVTVMSLMIYDVQPCQRWAGTQRNAANSRHGFSLLGRATLMIWLIPF